ncbi:MAG TPA: histidine kinase [Ignavibacteriales bacterium]|nr:histidine kinase [Ignavibacteriales bacterium]
MEKIREILKVKGNQIYSVSPDTTVYDALKLMAEKNIGAVVVLEGKKLFGIMSERDYARKVVLKSKFSKEVLVKEIMSNEIFCIDIDESITNTQAIMIQKRIRHLPVIDKNELVGIVSIGDIVKASIDNKTFLIDQLITYIRGIPAPQKEQIFEII